MNKYESLLLKIAAKYGIKMGSSETESMYKARIIYSVCAVMGYASLWDQSDEKDISIDRVKSRIGVMLGEYLGIYPEVKNLFELDHQNVLGLKTVEDEIYENYLKGGAIYHCPYHIAPALRSEAPFRNICFQRGIPFDEITCLSGAGFYSEVNTDGDPLQVRRMFALEEVSLHDMWNNVVSKAEWISLKEFNSGSEFLRMNPPFTTGYWMHMPFTDGRISLLRVGSTGSRLYFLYRVTKCAFEVSPLPNWQVDDNNYRRIACSCLAENGSLPPIGYKIDGAVVKVHLNYLLPPAEMNFLKLYSWPYSYRSLPSDFKRICANNVFHAIENIFQCEGFEFREE